MSASREQIQELSNAIALQAAAIADGKIDEDTVYAQVRLIASNVKTLQAWTEHLNPNEPNDYAPKSEQPFVQAGFNDLEASVTAALQTYKPQCCCDDSDVYDGYAECPVHPAEDD